MKKVLFACVHNAGRSQMAAAVVAVMQEVGIDLSRQTPKFLSDELAGSAALLITMGCGEACPFVPGLRRDDWPLQDPKGQPLAEVRRIRDLIHARVQELLAREGWARGVKV
jgi:arsenate reductase